MIARQVEAVELLPVSSRWRREVDGTADAVGWQVERLEERKLLNGFGDDRQTVARQVEIPQAAAVAECIATHRVDAVVAERQGAEDEEASEQSVTDGGDAVVRQVESVQIEEGHEGVSVDGLDEIRVESENLKRCQIAENGRIDASDGVVTGVEDDETDESGERVAVMNRAEIVVWQIEHLQLAQTGQWSQRKHRQLIAVKAQFAQFTAIAKHVRWQNRELIARQIQRAKRLEAGKRLISQVSETVVLQRERLQFAQRPQRQRVQFRNAVPAQIQFRQFLQTFSDVTVVWSVGGDEGHRLTVETERGNVLQSVGRQVQARKTGQRTEETSRCWDEAVVGQIQIAQLTKTGEWLVAEGQSHCGPVGVVRPDAETAQFSESGQWTGLDVAYFARWDAQVTKTWQTAHDFSLESRFEEEHIAALDDEWGGPFRLPNAGELSFPLGWLQSTQLATKWWQFFSLRFNGKHWRRRRFGFWCLRLPLATGRRCRWRGRRQRTAAAAQEQQGGSQHLARHFLAVVFFCFLFVFTRKKIFVLFFTLAIDAMMHWSTCLVWQNTRKRTDHRREQSCKNKNKQSNDENTLNFF